MLKVASVPRREVKSTADSPPGSSAPVIGLRVIGREAAALVVSLALWTGLALVIVVFAWRFTSVWWFILVPPYLPAPLAALVYVLLLHPRSVKKSIKRAASLVAFGWVASNPIPGNPLFSEILRVFLFFHPLPENQEGALGIAVGLLISYWVVGIPYCVCSAYWAACLGSAVLDASGRRA